MVCRRNRVIGVLVLMALLCGATVRCARCDDHPNPATIDSSSLGISNLSLSSGLLMPAMLVLLMPAGLALISCGMCRAKNSAHAFTVGLMIMPLAGIAFFVFGFALAFGNAAHGLLPPGLATMIGGNTSALDHGLGIGASDDAAGKFAFGLIGTKGFCLAGVSDPVLIAVFFFTMTLAIVAASITTGAMAERWAWKSFLLYGAWVVLLVAVYANWMWGGGWLAQAGVNWGWGHGAVDFAGSGVIQGVGGMIALAGAICIGPRLGKYVGGRARAMPGHSVPFVVLGTFVLLLAWFGIHSAPHNWGAMSRWQ